MPRDLADVLHYFLPELDDDQAVDATSITPSPSLPASDKPAPTNAGGRGRIASAPRLPILGLPIGDQDVVRTALAWNLSVETSRLGGTSLLVAPETDRDSPIWPEPGVGPLGCELLFCPSKDLASLYETAGELAARRARKSQRGGIVFVRIPPAWLTHDRVPQDLMRWILVLTRPNRRDLSESLDLAATLTRIQPDIELGITIHGVQRIAEARSAFERLGQAAKDQLGLGLISYGLLVDDLNVYRAIAAQRPIGLAHPQAPATRALMDVARLLYQDARSRVLG
jgi:hypothetical protein